MQSDQGSCSNQVTGKVGEELTILCLANEPVENAVWMIGGVEYSSNITFGYLIASEAGVYICRGKVQDQEVSSSINLKISSELY